MTVHFTKWLCVVFFATLSAAAIAGDELSFEKLCPKFQPAHSCRPL